MKKNVFQVLSIVVLITLLTCCRQNTHPVTTTDKQPVSTNKSQQAVTTAASTTPASNNIVKQQKPQQTSVTSTTLVDPEGDNNKSPEQDGMEQAMEFEFLKTRDPALGRIPNERLAIAAKLIDEMPQYNPQNRTSALSWSERGPTNIGGRTRAILVDKNDASGNTVFAGSVSGGIWKCTNFLSAYSWTKVDDNMNNLAVTALAQSPLTPNIMYAGTGEGYYNVDAVRGGGIFRSMDGGATWAPLTSTVPDYAALTKLDFEFIQDIVVTSAGIVYASARSGTYCNAGGVFKSTDAGLSWTRVIGNYPGGGCGFANYYDGADLEIAANGDLYATTGVTNASGVNNYGKVWKSAASLGANQGNSGQWTNVTPVPPAGDPGFQRIDIACAPSNNQFVYAICQNYNTLAIRRNYQSTNGGGSWTEVVPPTWCDQGTPTADFTRGQAFYDLITAIDPTNANNVYIGGIDLMKSLDGGLTFTQLTQWAGNNNCGAMAHIHADNHNIIFINNSASNFIASNDGGIYLTTDGGATFSSRNSGYDVTQYYSVAMHPSNANYFLAGAQDNGTHKFNSAGLNSVTEFSGGDGALCHISQRNPLIQITAYVYSNFFISRDGGNSILYTTSNNSGMFINPTSYDETAGILYRGSNAGILGRYENIASGVPLSSSVAVTGLAGYQISAMIVDPNASNTVWIAGYGGGTVAPVTIKVQNANTGAPVSTVVNIPGVASGAFISCIDVEKGNSNHLLVTISNYGVQQVWESVNGGTNWVNIDGTLPDMPVRWGIFLPSGSNEGVIALATDLGVYTTAATNAGSTAWVTNNSGFPRVRTDMLKFRQGDNTLVAATHGRGIFTATLGVTPVTWNGSSSNLWTTAANWTPARVPTQTDNVVIPTGASNMPVSVTGTQTIYGATIQASASLNITGTLQVAGSLVNNGTASGTGSLTLNGIIAQSISGNGTVSNLTLNNSTGAVITSGAGNTVSLTGALTLTSGALNTNSNLTLKSTSTTTARVAPVTGGSITGNVIVERYIGNAVPKAAWRLLTAPIKASSGTVSIWSTWQNSGVNTSGIGTSVTGPAYNGGTNGLDATSAGPSIQFYDVATSTLLQPVIDTKTGASTTPLATTSGNRSYFVFVNGDRTSSTASPNNTTLSALGLLQTGDVVVPTASTNAGDNTLVGNPYASPVDLQLFRNDNTASNSSTADAATKTNYYYWDPYLTGTYGLGGYVTVAYDLGGVQTITPSTGHTQYLQSGQAMFLERRTAAGGNPFVTFKETHKVTNDVPGIFRNSSGVNNIEIMLNVIDAGTPALTDGVTALYNNNYSADVDDYDASKFFNMGESFSLRRNSVDLSIERRPGITSKDTLFFNMRNLAAGKTYQFKFLPDFAAPSLLAFLQDTYQPGINKPVSLTSPGTIDFTVTADPASQAPDRFRIVFAATGPLPLTFTNVKAYQQNSSIAVEWNTENESGMKQYEVERSANGTLFSKLNTTNALNTPAAKYKWLDVTPMQGYNYYRIRSIGQNGQARTSNIVKVFIGKGATGIAIYPNPVKDGKFNFQLTNMEKGMYQLRLISQLGQVVYTTIVQHEGGSASEIISLDRETIKGTYTLEIITPSDSKIKQKLVF